jgi:hypothetical protein
MVSPIPLPGAASLPQSSPSATKQPGNSDLPPPVVLPPLVASELSGPANSPNQGPVVPCLLGEKAGLALGKEDLDEEATGYGLGIVRQMVHWPGLPVRRWDVALVTAMLRYGGHLASRAGNVSNYSARSTRHDESLPYAARSSTEGARGQAFSPPAKPGGPGKPDQVGRLLKPLV